METPTELLRAPEIFKLFAGDPLFERVQEIKELIARRTYELSEARGFTHGHELEDWLRAQSESCAAVRWISERRKRSLPFLSRCLGSGRGTLRYELSPAASLSVASAKKLRSAGKERPCIPNGRPIRSSFSWICPPPLTQTRSTRRSAMACLKLNC